MIKKKTHEHKLRHQLTYWKCPLPNFLFGPSLLQHLSASFYLVFARLSILEQIPPTTFHAGNYSKLWGFLVLVRLVVVAVEGKEGRQDSLHPPPHNNPFFFCPFNRARSQSKTIFNGESISMTDVFPNSRSYPGPPSPSYSLGPSHVTVTPTASSESSCHFNSLRTTTGFTGFNGY